MQTHDPLLGTRRQAKICQILTQWRNSTTVPCMTTYMKWYCDLAVGGAPSQTM
mgnify:CR=1 FL=1